MQTYIYKYRYMLILMMASLLTLVGCDIHEYPKVDDPNTEYDLVLDLEFAKDLPIHKEVEVETKTKAESEGEEPDSKADTKSWIKASTDPEDYDFRHVVQIYRADEKGKFSRNVYRRITRFRDDVSIKEDTIKLTLPAGQYRFIAWTDNVLEGGMDYFYNTSQFEEIMLQGEHIGCNDLRDAFTGATDDEILKDAENVVPLSMKRPLAKYTFISTDFAEFRTKVLTMLAAKAEAARKEAEAKAAAEAARKEAETKGADSETKVPDTDTKVIDLEDFKIEFQYSGFMQSSYNLYNMTVADAKPGVRFETRISQYDEKSAELGFDYVFVNDDNPDNPNDDPSVNVTIVTYDMDGNVMAKSKGFEVPLKRGKHTIVTGRFLTTMSSGAIGIDPGFDGEFNVVIPD